jgi:F-type H+-transporting ATPase subunit b
MLQLDVWNVLFTVINLLILFVLMRIFLYKPVQKIIAARQAEADKQFDEAAAKQSEAEELKTKYEAVLSDAENEKKKVVAEARKTADEEYQRIVTDAHKTASQIKDNAFTLLVNNCICCDRCLTCLTVTNNKLSLSTSYREH